MMKILLVDDNPRRYQRLVEQLISSSTIGRNDIHIVTCAMDARSRLSTVKYDLMVIDIVLPLRPEEDPQERHSIDLLREVIEYGEMIKPRQIVGLSAFENIAERIAPFFGEHLWTVINYSEANDSWISQIQNCISYLKEESAEQEPNRYLTDLAIVCALADPELHAILQLPWHWSAARPISDVLFGHDGWFEIGGHRVTVFAAAQSRMGMVSAALVCAQMIEILRPKFLVMAGVCAGVRGKTEIGDPLLIDPSWDWQSGKRVKDQDNGAFSISPHQIPVQAEIRSRFEQLRANGAALAKIADAWHHPPSHRLKLVIGPVASGSAVLADGEVVVSIRNQHRDLIGVEMEAYGLYCAATVCSHPRPIAFAVKSVCDFADPDKNDSQQRYAAFTSANMLQLFFETYFLELIIQN